MRKVKMPASAMLARRSDALMRNSSGPSRPGLRKKADHVGSEPFDRPRENGQARPPSDGDRVRDRLSAAVKRARGGPALSWQGTGQRDGRFGACSGESGAG